MITQILRSHGVVEKFVEFFGDGLNSNMTVADRATIANMAPEYGATIGFFPVDDQTLAYLRLTGREEGQIDLVERYCKEQGLWRNNDGRSRFTPKRWNWTCARSCPAWPARAGRRIGWNCAASSSHFELQPWWTSFKKSVGEVRYATRLDRWSAEAPGAHENGNILATGPFG